jgi:hypothetical protein
MTAPIVRWEAVDRRPVSIYSWQDRAFVPAVVVGASGARLRVELGGVWNRNGKRLEAGAVVTVQRGAVRG